MENGEIKKTENVIVKKGLIYYLFAMIRWFFKVIWIILKIVYAHIKSYIDDIGDSIIHGRKEKKLNKMRLEMDNEVI